jgi:hypothetical protein
MVKEPSWPRHALVEMENLRMEHQTALYVSYNGAASSSEEAESLKKMGD